jgi:SET domain-containing protein
VIKSLFLNFNSCLSVKKDRLSCSFTSIPVLTITDAFIISAHTLMVNTKKAVVIAGATIYNFNHEIRNNESDFKTF